MLTDKSGVFLSLYVKIFLLFTALSGTLKERKRIFVRMRVKFGSRCLDFPCQSFLCELF